MDERIEDLMALYALGGLTVAEQQEVDAYLDLHPEYDEDLREMMQTTSALAHSAPPLPPSREMKETLMARVEADAAARFPPRPVSEPPQQKRLSWRQGLRALLSPPVVGTAGFALATLLLIWGIVLTDRLATARQQVSYEQEDITRLQSQVEELTESNLDLYDEMEALTGENTELRTQLTDLTEERDAAAEMAAGLLAENSELAEELAVLLAANETLLAEYAALEESFVSLADEYTDADQVLSLFTSPQTEQVFLPGTEAQPAAEGQLLYDPDSQLAVLFVDDMPPLATNQVYQVLLIRDDGHDTAETFAVNVQGQNALIVHAQAPLNTFTAVGVSVEPEGGSVQRTGDIMLLGELASS